MTRGCWWKTTSLCQFWMFHSVFSLTCLLSLLQVNNTVVNITSSVQTFFGVDLSDDDTGVTAVFSTPTQSFSVFFDGDTAQISMDGKNTSDPLRKDETRLCSWNIVYFAAASVLMLWLTLCVEPSSAAAASSPTGLCVDSSKISSVRLLQYSSSRYHMIHVPLTAAVLLNSELLHENHWSALAQRQKRKVILKFCFCPTPHPAVYLRTQQLEEKDQTLTKQWLKGEQILPHSRAELCLLYFDVNYISCHFSQHRGKKNKYWTQRFFLFLYLIVVTASGLHPNINTLTTHLTLRPATNWLAMLSLTISGVSSRGPMAEPATRNILVCLGIGGNKQNAVRTEERMQDL